MVTCGDSFTYPADVGGVQHCMRGSGTEREEGGAMIGRGNGRLFPWRGARSFWTARREARFWLLLNILQKAFSLLKYDDE